MRGKGERRKAAWETSRITPAHAGKRPDNSSSSRANRDHPRTCGEKLFFGAQWAQMAGSPPHMRGKVHGYHPELGNFGITPAHAGKSGDSYDYKTWDAGSPPHMRGKALLNEVVPRVGGITPAHAGKRLKRSRSIVPHAAIVPLFPSVCNKPAGSDGSPAGHDAPPFLPIENAAPASPAYNLRSL